MGDVAFYMEGGKKRDAGIHDAIIAEGEGDLDGTVEFMVGELGFTREEAEAFLKPEGKKDSGEKPAPEGYDAGRKTKERDK